MQIAMRLAINWKNKNEVTIYENDITVKLLKHFRVSLSVI